VQLKDILKEKRRGKVTKGVLFLRDNVVSTKETTLVGHISDIVRSGRGSDFVTQKE
jgi:hypothetical protein